MSSALDKIVISEYARRENISHKEAERRFASLTDTILDCILQIGRVNLRRIGLFHVAERKNAKWKNHHTGMTESVPLIKVLKFKPSKTFKQILNKKIKYDLESKFRS